MRHLGKNPVLSMDDLCELKDVRPRLEKEFTLPGDSRGSKNKIYFFSIDGTLRGTRLTHCLFAGECIMVQAKGFEAANKLAKDGLHETLELAIEYWRDSQGALLTTEPVNAGLVVDAAGGRVVHADPRKADLATDPVLKRMIRDAMAKKK